MKKEELGVPKKKSVIVLCLLCLITLGIYPYVWYLKRVPEINNLRTEEKAGKTIAGIALVFYVALLLGLVFLGVYASITNDSVEIVTELSEVPLPFVIILTAVFLIFLILLTMTFAISFRYWKILNEALVNKEEDMKLSSLFTFFFHLFYLQYEINRIIDDKENEKRTGPWICFILFVVVPVLIGITIGLLAVA